MSGRSDWRRSHLPPVVARVYERQTAGSMTEEIHAGRMVWRYSGTNHLEFRHVGTGLRLSVTLGKNAADPVYPAKWRSFLRRCKSE